MIDERTIYEVVTLREAAWMFCRHHSLIMLHITCGHLVARKSKGTWIVGLDSLIALWGQPVQKFYDCQ